MFVLDRNQTTVELAALPKKIVSVGRLGGGTVSMDETNGTVFLHLKPRLARTATVVKMQLDGSAMNIPAIGLP